jgi:hypothetical protein
MGAMPDDNAGIPQQRWIIYAAAAGGLLLWAMWQVIETLTPVFSGEIIFVN